MFVTIQGSRAHPTWPVHALFIDFSVAFLFTMPPSNFPRNRSPRLPGLLRHTSVNSPGRLLTLLGHATHSLSIISPIHQGAIQFPVQAGCCPYSVTNASLYPFLLYYSYSPRRQAGCCPYSVTNASLYPFAVVFVILQARFLFQAFDTAPLSPSTG
jgi:hypothetical protein